MEATLRELCQQHGLTSISVMFQAERWNRATAYLHWGDDGICASGGGSTFDEAMSHALADMNDKRDLAAQEHAEGRVGDQPIEARSVVEGVV